MTTFWNGFEKQAVSLNWLNKHTQSGIVKRLKALGIPKATINKAMTDAKVRLAEAEKHHIKDLGMSRKLPDWVNKWRLNRSHWRGVVPKGQTAGSVRKDLHEAVKKTPKTTAGGEVAKSPKFTNFKEDGSISKGMSTGAKAALGAAGVAAAGGGAYALGKSRNEHAKLRLK